MKTSKTPLHNLQNKKPFSMRMQSAWLICVFFFASCAVSLAPKFDQAIVDNLSSASTEIFQLVAEVTDGTKKDDYNTREDKYNHVIGELDALELQIEARPVPKNKSVDKIIGKVNDRLREKGIGTIDANETAPSATAIKHITENIAKMKDTDKLQGLTKTEVLAFKNNIQLFLDQALTYERFLNQ
jgi:hypothetical protein